MSELMEGQYWDTMQHNADLAQRYELANKLGAMLSVDGNQYCWLIGEDLMQGVAGFGDTAAEALKDLWMNFHNMKARSTT